jgi:hypothetical protein
MKITLDSIFNVDRRIVFIFVFLALFIPLLIPYAMPCKATRDVQSMYDAIEAAAAAKKPVFLSFEFDPTGAAEQEPMARSVVRHLFARGGKAVVICKSGGQLGEALHQQILEDCALEYDKTYGEDYVYLPFKPGSTTVVINLGQSVVSAWPKDFRGTDLGKIPLTRNINRLADFDYVMIICSSLTTVIDWITYAQSPYNLKMGFGVLGNVTPDVANYVQSGQVVGLLGGLVGAAQYEQLVRDNGIGEQRRFSTADLIRSQLPAFCSKLVDEKAGPVAKHVFQSVTPDVQDAIRKTANQRFDKLTQEHKRAINVALNNVISRSDLIPDAELADIKITSRSGASLTAADLLRIKRRVYVENLFPSELAKAFGSGRAMQWMTPQSVAHIILIVAIIFGNICYFIDRARRRKAQVGA